MANASAKAARRAFCDRLATLSDDELQNLKHEVGRSIQVARDELNAVNKRLTWIKLEQQRRATATPSGLHITDHAIVRYLERRRGLDIESVRAEIGEIAMRAKRERRGVKHDQETGLTIGYCEAQDHVTTVYRPRELETLSIRPPE